MDNSELTDARLMGVAVDAAKNAKNAKGRVVTVTHILDFMDKHLHLFGGQKRKGRYTGEEADKLIEAAEKYMADPANQVVMKQETLRRFR